MIIVIERAMMQRFSRQREAILSNLRSRSDHPSADMVYEELRREHPNISLGTVYRNLTMLADNGVILRLTRHNKDHFDGRTAPHMHFFCDKCGKIYDIFSDLSSDITKKAESELCCRIDSIDVSIRGLCAECTEKQK